MMRLALLSFLLLTGCTTHSLRSDYYETEFRAQQALDGKAAAFDRIAQLNADWNKRANAGNSSGPHQAPGGGKNQARAAFMADKAERIVRAKDAVLSQREMTEVMLNAFADLESEYDSMVDLLVGNEAPIAAFSAISEQKYLIRRMANSLVLMMQADMTNAVEAADLFGRDVARFQNLLDASINGNDEMGIDPPDDPQVEDSLAQIEELFTGYVADSAPDMLDNVAYRHDAWLALKEMDELGDGRKAKKPAAGKASAAADGTVHDAADDDESEPEGAPAGSDGGASGDANSMRDEAETGVASDEETEPSADGDMGEADMPEESEMAEGEAVSDESEPESAAGDDEEAF